LKFKTILLSNYKIFLLSILTLSLPFIEFYISNINKLNTYDLFELAKLFLIILSIIFISNIIFSIFGKKSFGKNLFYLSICFYVVFFHYNLKHILPFGIRSSEIALLIILILLAGLHFALKSKRFEKIISIYFVFLLIFNLFVAFKTEISLKKNVEDNFITDISVDYERLNKNNQSNVYLIILDEAASLEVFEENYNTKIKNEYLNIVENKGYIYIKDSVSSYNQTELTFTSYFNINYFLTEESSTYSDTKNFYPQVLRYNYENLPLIKILKENKYDFYLFGNARNNCSIKKEICYTKNLTKKDYIDREILEIFFLRSPLLTIYNKIDEKIKRYLKIESYKENFDSNDAIKKFIHETNGKIPQKSFFLLHNYYPHAPFVYNSDCKKKKGGKIVTEKNAHQAEKGLGYYENYRCALKKTREIIDYLNIYDPNAVVIIQADHGHYFNKERSILERMKIFNLVKSPEQCKELVNKQIDNVNAVRFLLKCGLDLNIKLLEKQSYWGPYLMKDKNWGKVKKLIN